LRVLAESKELPRWLAGKNDYDIWRRNNLWMMFNALATGASRRLFAVCGLQIRAKGNADRGMNVRDSNGPTIRDDRAMSEKGKQE
jgi:hypothetical protein